MKEIYTKHIQMVPQEARFMSEFNPKWEEFGWSEATGFSYAFHYGVRVVGSSKVEAIGLLDDFS